MHVYEPLINAIQIQTGNSHLVIEGKVFQEPIGEEERIPVIDHVLLLHHAAVNFERQLLLEIVSQLLDY